MSNVVSRLALVALVFAACSEADAPTPAPAKARVFRASPGTALSAPSSAAPDRILEDFLATQGSGVARLRIAGEQVGFDRIHVRFDQEINGLRVVGRYAKATLNDRGELLTAIDLLAAQPAGLLTPPRVDEAKALDSAVHFLGYLAVPPERSSKSRIDNFVFYDAGETYFSDPRVENVVFTDAQGELKRGFEVQTWSRVGNRLHQTVVDGSGRVVSVELRTASDSYNVFLEDPAKGAQTVVDGPGAGNAESPAGWLGAGAQNTINIAGNNVHAYLDAKANNNPDRGGVAVSNGQFLTAVDFASQPSTVGNQAVGVQNLFYFNNVIHDVLYRHGFNEAAGNFQADNFANGGSAGDPVNAEAQDGGGLDNANFATPADGSAPRMQMYLWSSPDPDHTVTVTAPAGIARDYDARGAEFGKALTTTGVTGGVVLVNDGVGTTSDGCEAFTGVSGKLALIDRGTCDFVTKVTNAQNAGAAGVIIANNTGGDATFVMGGSSKRIRISAVMVSQNSGALFKANLAGLTATAKKDAAVPIQLDGDLDADIVFHEYGHGLTWRMIGGMSGPLAGAIGEGASDTVAFLNNGDDRIGEYAIGDALGIRRAPYAGYPNTYSDVTGAEVHNDGEIYAAAMWRLHELFVQAGMTDSDLLDLFVDGMNYTPATPAYEDMRDGMLQSAAGNQAVQCLVWRAFAQYGIGEGASGTVGAGGTVTIVESFAVPASCP